jgi:hypothetical protein
LVIDPAASPITYLGVTPWDLIKLRILRMAGVSSWLLTITKLTKNFPVELTTPEEYNRIQ